MCSPLLEGASGQPVTVGNAYDDHCEVFSLSHSPCFAWKHMSECRWNTQVKQDGKVSVKQRKSVQVWGDGDSRKELAKQGSDEGSSGGLKEAHRDQREEFQKFPL